MWNIRAQYETRRTSKVAGERHTTAYHNAEASTEDLLPYSPYNVLPAMLPAHNKLPVQDVIGAIKGS